MQNNIDILTGTVVGKIRVDLKNKFITLNRYD